MSALERMVDDALLDPLAAARGHARAGGRVVGYVGAEIPVELIIASGAFPLRIPSFAHTSTALADRYLESSFSPDVRSIAEQYLQGALDFMDAVILPRSDDSAQRLYYYLSELRARRVTGGPRPLIYDLAKIPRSTSLVHSHGATQRLAVEIGAGEQALADAIAQRNRRRRLFVAAAQARTGGVGPCGSLMERISRAAGCCDAESFDAAFGDWLTHAPGHAAGPRVVLAGSVPPDDRLHRAVEKAGGNIVAEVGAHVSRALASPPIAADDPLEAIAAHYHSLEFGPRAFVDRASQLEATAQAARADGVIIWLLETEDALIWDLPAQLSALAGAGVPALPLARRRWDGGDGALDEIASFTRGLRSAA
jgi:benzoyl-CoA reductase/2-hydroxyglutaryl-CoA dehydratase subunit BcrC/BadD/HgdB